MAYPRKLSIQDRRDILSASKQGASMVALAKKFGVSKQRIHQLRQEAKEAK